MYRKCTGNARSEGGSLCDIPIPSPSIPRRRCDSFFARGRRSAIWCACLPTVVITSANEPNRPANGIYMNLLRRFVEDPGEDGQLHRTHTEFPSPASGLPGKAAPHKQLERVYAVDCAGPESNVVPQERMVAVPASLRLHLYVLFGSNRGGCETLASRFVSQASQRGAQTFFSDLDSFDDWSGASRPQTVLVIICSTYNGLPPQNAVEFMRRLEARKVLPRVKFAVFGVGN